MRAVFSDRFLLTAASAACAIFIAASPANAVSERAYFGQSMPAFAGDLPPGLLRSQLDNLPAPAKSRALRWLQDLDFPAADTAFLRADRRGGIFYEDPAHSGDAQADSASEAFSISEVTPANVFQLHSKPGASRVVYLDMDGHSVSGTAWNAASGIASHDMQPFDTDGVPGSFSTSEIEVIAETWKRVAEDYAAYDIDVTTEQPPSFGPNVGHILVSPRTDANGNLIYPNSAGGVAYVGVWGQSNFSYYQPALVFPESLASSGKYMAEAASHELGHNLGLSHDGNSSIGYYQGHGTDNTSWGPIMGVGYYSNVSQWSKGEYLDANNTQDDLAIIAGRLGYRIDDHADTDFNAATPLVRSGSSDIIASNPVTDPDNLTPYNKGVIGDRLDVDLFSMDVNAGTIALTVTPAWVADYRAYSRRSANLDIRATLYDVGGNLVAQNDPSDDTFAQISASVPAGRYLLAIEGVGVRTAADGYTDYGSIGQYFINGSLPGDAVTLSPPNAPTDLFASLNGNGDGIDLSWTDPASQIDNNETGYRVFRRIDGGAWSQIADLLQDSSAYADNNLGAGSYVYYVEPYNSAGANASNLSDTVTIAVPVSSYAYASSELTSAGLVSSGSYLNTQASSGAELLSEAHQGGKPANRVSALDHSWTVTGIQPGALIVLEVAASAPANSEGDDFAFSYAINGGPSQPLGTLHNGTGAAQLLATLPASTSGSLTLRVVDTDRTRGNSTADTLSVSSIRVHSSGDPAEQAPQVSISAPGNGFSIVQGTAFDLVGQASDFEDGELSSSISWSSDVDGHLHTGASATVNGSAAPLSIGSHLISAQVTDSAGLSGEQSVSITILDPAAPSESHVANLVGSTSLNRKKWSASVTATVIDDHGNPVSYATLSGNWSGAASEAASCVTNSSGQCSVSVSNMNTRNSSVTFAVSNIAHASLSYAPGSNLVSSITLTAP